MTEFRRDTKARSTGKSLLIIALLSFALGGALVGYFAYRIYDQRLDEVQTTLVSESPRADRANSPITPAPSASDATTDDEVPTDEATRAATQVVERVAEQQGGLDQRLAAAEQRLARLDLQAQAAEGNIARAEGLLIAFAARRSMERGTPLGFLADQLRLRFGDALPNAVNTVIRVSRDPVTVDQLIARLDGLSDDLAQPEQGFSLERVRRELSSLFVIRRETTPSARPIQRLERARFFLESGRVEAAIAEVRNLPGANQARDWIADAERYAAAQQALDLIETSAVLEPRRLRTGQGERVEQPSPAARNIEAAGN